MDRNSKEQELVDKIAKRMERRLKDAYETGEDINKLVELKGGVKYGAKTIESLSQQIDCSARQLRRYWVYYRLDTTHGKDIRKTAPKLGKSYWYELARFLDAGVPEAEEKRRILEYVEWMSKRDKLGIGTTVDQFRVAISKAIEKIKGGENLTPSNPKPTKAKQKSKIGSVLAFQEGGIKVAADYLMNFAEPAHLGKGDLNPNEIFLQTNRIADSLTNLVTYLVGTDKHDDVVKAVQHLVRELNNVLTPTDSDHQLIAVNE